jgi:hypothetical protein
VRWMARGLLRRRLSREVLPDVPLALQLEDATLVRVKEIVATWNPMAVRRPDLALLPARGRHASAVRLAVGNHVDPVLYAVLDPCRTGRHQSSGSLSLLCHEYFDARAAISGLCYVVKITLHSGLPVTLT